MTDDITPLEPQYDPKGRILEVIPLTPFVQCEAIVTSTADPFGGKWRDERYGRRGLNPRLCCRKATLQGFGLNLCRRHMGEFVTDLIMEIQDGNDD